MFFTLIKTSCINFPTSKNISELVILQRVYCGLNPTPMFYVGGVLQNTYFHSNGYYKVCGIIGRAETFEEFGSQWHGLRGSMGMAIKIWVGQKNTLYWC